MMLGPKAQALSYLVPTKYLFLPYSQTHSLEIPFIIIIIIIIISSILIVTKMNCLYTGMQWNKRSPQVVLEAILVQRILLFEQFVSASKLAPEVLKERNCV